jgi:two-component sensor histidine kinase
MSPANIVEPAGFLTLKDHLRAPERAMDTTAERAAFEELAALVLASPSRALRRFPESARRLCFAGTAGMSLLRSDETGSETIHWTAIDGALTAHEGAQTPREFSSCGLCLDRGATSLVSQPARVFRYLRYAQPLIVEHLIAPLSDADGRALGTLWMVHHDSEARFTSSDARILEQLGTQLVLTLGLLQRARGQQRLFGSGIATRRVMARQLMQERARRQQAEAAEQRATEALLFQQMLTKEVHHRTKNTLQMASSLLSLQSGSCNLMATHDALERAQARLHLLANVHELLYKEASDTQQVRVSQLLEQLAEPLRLVFADKGIQLRVASEPILLPPAAAIPLTLLINEVVTNAYKHAFVGRQAGAISIRLTGTAEEIWLKITDDGVGMPDAVTASASPGLGLKLIRSLAGQLRGALTFASAPQGGTEISLQFQRGATAADTQFSSVMNLQ